MNNKKIDLIHTLKLASEIKLHGLKTALSKCSEEDKKELAEIEMFVKEIEEDNKILEEIINDYKGKSVKEILDIFEKEYKANIKFVDRCDIDDPTNITSVIHIKYDDKTIAINKKNQKLLICNKCGYAEDLSYDELLLLGELINAIKKENQL